MTSLLVQRYQKARAACALYHLEDWGVLSVDGPDARDFLQRLSTQDLRNLAAGEGTQTLFLKGDGRLAADAAILCSSPEQFILLTPAACRDSLLNLLEQYHFAENLTITDRSANYYTAMISGPRRAEICDFIKKSCDASEVECICANVTFAPAAPRGIFLIPTEKFAGLRGQVYEAIESAGGVIASEDLFDTLRIEEGMPLYGADLSEKTIPLEAGQNAAISFTKGCFPGQEIVARINNLGHPANVLVGLTLPESTEKLIGCELLAEGKTVGRITSAAFSPGISGMLGLGYIKWNQREPGTVLTISGDGQLKAAVTAVPLPGLDPA